MAGQTEQAVRPEAVSTPPPGSSPQPRTDIQGLRAIAVALVLLYHLWPDRLTGGFVGVDVFFVISGFLITSHLLTKPPRHLRDLATFWARRIRRLLPASLTVLAVTAVATRLVAPDTQWLDTARQIRSAALYVLNWRLADDAVDYSAADNAATPAQHFWSLSVEEQFYLGWPVLIAALFLFAARTRRRPLGVVLLGLLLVVVASLSYGVWLTEDDPSRAYFVTPTRVWELGVGGLLAAVITGRATAADRPAPLAGVRTAVTWGGLVAITWSAIAYTGSTPFPGWYAAVPVLGAAAVIAAADPRGFGAPGGALATRPVQWLGDASYSVYLWHWPLVVLMPNVSGGSLGWLDKSAIVVVTLVLAGLTKRFVEDPFRGGRPGTPLYKPYLAAAVGMALVVGMATVQLAEVSQRDRADEERLEAAVKGGGACFGAAALDTDARCSPEPTGRVVPSPAQAIGDRYDSEHTLLTSEKCWAPRRDPQVKTCAFGDPGGDVDVAVVGNSHAAQWMAGLHETALRRGWRITTFFAHNCALSATPQAFDNAAQADACQYWIQRTTTMIAEGSFDLVVLSNRVSKPPAGETAESSRSAFAAGYETVLRQWQRPGLTVVGLHDTPWPGATMGRVPECLAKNPDNYEVCSGPRSEWEPRDPLEQAIRAVGDRRIESVNLNDHICGPRQCPGVVGGVIVYSDFSHLTTTYVRTLTPYLERALVEAVRAAE